MDEIARLDATAQAELLRHGELSPSELVEGAVRRAERLDPQLGALIHPAFERALGRAKSADLPDGPFRGVPFAMKDLGGAEAGMPHHAGLGFVARAGFVEAEDAFLTRRFRDAGLVSIGRTNTPELALLPTTEPAAYGPTRNPWNLEHSSGGSSGGASALVAAGVVPAAHASDGGGSIRGPASMCGLVGLKPTRGRNSFGPSLGERWSGLSCEFVLTRTVRDAAALLDATSGPMTGDPYFAPPPARPFLESLAAPGSLRVGVLRRPLRDVAVDADFAASVEATAIALEALGHRVATSHPEALDDPAHVGAYVNVVSANVARALDAWGARVGHAPTEDDVEPLTWALAERGRTLSAADHLATLEAVHGFGRRVAAWWESGFDLLLTPTMAAAPPRIGFVSSTREEPLRAFLRAAPYGVFTLPFNLTGQPALSLPGAIGADGLPRGVQLVAAAGREDLLLAVAAQLEEARPWRGQVPPLHA